MKNMMFPTIVVDDFFDYPDDVCDFANSLEYKKDPLNAWPGLRTDPLHEISPVFFKKTVNRLVNLYYGHDVNRNWSVNMFFQKVNSTYSGGWIHTDSSSILSNVVYLNRNPNPNSGTSIYEIKDKINGSIINTDEKEMYYAGFIDDDSIHREQNNKQFTESVTVKNVYNRLISFDGHLYHGANEFVDEERLTLVFFFNDLHVDCEKYPLLRMRTSSYTYRN